MKFKLTGSNNVGHGVTRSLLETIPLSDTNNITFTKDLRPTIEEDVENKTITLEVIWEYMLFYNGNEFFDFDTTMRYWVTETNTLPIFDDLIEIITHTHKHLIESFNERRKEFNGLSKMEDIHHDTIEQFALQLQEELLLVHGQ